MWKLISDSKIQPIAQFKLIIWTRLKTWKACLETPQPYVCICIYLPNFLDAVLQTSALYYQRLIDRSDYLKLCKNCQYFYLYQFGSNFQNERLSLICFTFCLGSHFWCQGYKRQILFLRIFKNWCEFIIKEWYFLACTINDFAFGGGNILVSGSHNLQENWEACQASCQVQ